MHQHQTKIFKNHEFILTFVSADKNKAKRKAEKYRKYGFHTRVEEGMTGEFNVYRRQRDQSQSSAIVEPPPQPWSDMLFNTNDGQF